MDDHLHWFPRIQFSGTGLTLVSTLAPTLGVEIPYAFRAGGAALGVLMIAWPLFSYLGQLLRSARSMLPNIIVAVSIGAALMVWNYWYSSNYLRNGGIWHVKLGIAPPPPPAPPASPVQLPPPTPKPPWVTTEEIDQQKKLGRTLSIYSPQELLAMVANDENVDVFKGRWIKLDYPVERVPVSFTTQEKKEYYVVVINFGFVGLARDSLDALFDPKKYGDRLVNLRKGDQLKAVCQFLQIDRGKPFNTYNMRDDALFVSNCELL